MIAEAHALSKLGVLIFSQLLIEEHSYVGSLNLTIIRSLIYNGVFDLIEYTSSHVISPYELG
jgi:hypothetical protein